MSSLSKTEELAMAVFEASKRHKITPKEALKKVRNTSFKQSERNKIFKIIESLKKPKKNPDAAKNARFHESRTREDF